MRRSDSLSDTEFRHYDSLALALLILDTVIDHLGLEHEADRDVLARKLTPALTAMDAAAGISPSPERHERILDKLLGGLRNDGDARRPIPGGAEGVRRNRRSEEGECPTRRGMGTRTPGYLRLLKYLEHLADPRN